MKNALISPNEKIYSYDGIYLGFRVAEIADNQFPIAEPLFWVECADNVVADQWYYDETNKTIDLIPINPNPPELI